MRIRFTEWLTLGTWAGLIVRHYVSGRVLPLDEFTDRTIGASVLSLTDVEGRTTLLFHGLALGSLSLLVLLMGAYVGAVSLRLLRHGATNRFQRLLLPLPILALAEVVVVLKSGGPPAGDAGLMLLVALQVCVIGAAALLAFRREIRFVPQRVAVLFALSIGAFCLSVAVLDVTATARPPVSVSQYVLAMAVFLPFFWVFYPKLIGLLCAQVRPNMSPDRTIVVSVVGLAGLPAAPVAAQEIAYGMLVRFDISWAIPRVTLAVMVLVIATGIVMSLSSRIALRRSSGWVLGHIVLPIALAAYALHVHFPRAGAAVNIDPFHHGETVLPLHQLVHFGSLPYLDILPTHGLIDYVGPLAWLLVSGQSSSNDGAYMQFGLMAATGIAATYLCARSLTHSIVGAFALAVFAFVWSPNLVAAYGIPLLGVVSLVRAFRRGTTRAFLAVGVLVAILIAWRTDAGAMFAATAAASTLLYVLLRLPNVATFRILGAVALPTVIAAVALLAMLLTRADGSQSISVLIQFISLGFQGMSTGLVSVFSNAVPRSTSDFWHFVIPGVVFVLSLRLLLQLVHEAFRRRRLDERGLGVITLAFFSLLLFSRTFGRHTEFEAGQIGAFQMSFFPLTLPLLFGAFRSRGFLALSGLLLLMSLSPITLSTRVPLAVAEFPRATVSEHPMRTSASSIQFRVDAGFETELDQLRRTLNADLREGATFAELGNQPLLYVLTDRKFPGYVIPMLYTVSETTQLQYLRRVAAGHVDLVVLRSEKWWRAIDGVPDPVRNYRVHEWAHREFEHAELIGPYIVLSHPRGPQPPALPPTTVQLSDNLQRNSTEYVRQGTTDALTLTATGGDPWILLPLRPPVVLDGASPVTVELELRTAIAGNYQIFFGEEGAALTQELSKIFAVEVAQDYTRYSVVSPPLPRGTLTRIRFDSPTNAVGRVDVRNIRVRTGIPEDSSIGDFRLNLGFLPELWASRDPYSALTATAVVRDVRPSSATSAGARTIPPKSTVELTFDPIPTAATNYIQVTATAPSTSVLSVSYRKADDPAVASAPMAFFVRGGDHPSDYLLRPSIQRMWAANRSPIVGIVLRNESDTPITVQRLIVRSGD